MSHNCAVRVYVIRYEVGKMIDPTGYPDDRDKWIIRTNDRAMGIATEILTTFECTMTGLGFVLGQPLRKGHAECAVPITNGRVLFAYQGLAEAQIKDIPIRGLKFEFISGSVDESFGRWIDGNKVSTLAARQYGHLFASYWEQQLDCIYAVFGADAKAWPPLLNFCRMVRNSAAHGGKISVTNPNSPAGEWRRLTIGYQNHGQILIGPPGLETGDLILLIRDLTIFLDGKGVGIPKDPVPHKGP